MGLRVLEKAIKIIDEEMKAVGMSPFYFCDLVSFDFLFLFI
jgi:prolyl-tRNA synthetase